MKFLQGGLLGLFPPPERGRVREGVRRTHSVLVCAVPIVSRLTPTPTLIGARLSMRSSGPIVFGAGAVAHRGGGELA